MIEEIGQKIRDLRAAADLTQDELAQRAGLTGGFISQLERGESSISIDSLKMILDALNISFAEFFSAEEPEPIVFRTADRTELDQNGSSKLILLAPGSANRDMEPALLRLPPGGTTDVWSPFDGDLYGYALKGRFVLKYGKEEYRVQKDENFYFTADKEHCFSNPFKREAEVLLITAPPNF